MRLPYYCPLLTLVPLLVGGALQAQSPTGAVIRGRVLAPPGDAPSRTLALRNLRIVMDDEPSSATTDGSGRFQLGGVAVGAHRLVVLRAHQRLATRELTIANADTLDIEILLPTSSSATLAPVVVSADRPLHVIGHLADVDENVIYAGKKTEVMLLDSLHANVAQDVERQILGRIPGAHFSETAGAGFPSNGVSFRGLDPTQSVELNTRQNGVGIAADLFGYPETYYTPPAEALERIEVVHGAGSLAFGPQFGGAINYVVRHGEVGGPTMTSRQTTGSYGLFNSFNAIGGGTRSLTYYAFFHYRGADGWRPNSDYRQTTAYATTVWRPSNRLTLSVEHTRYRNRIHMAGGLSDEQFAEDPSLSFRARNWLASPWNVSALRAAYTVSPRVRLESTLSYMASDRHLIWRNEDGGPAAPDEMDPATGTFSAREVERETFENWTSESRLRIDHQLFGRSASLTTGTRAGWNRMYRFESGPGSTGTDFDMSLYGGSWERALYFRTPNMAAFAEELLRPSHRLSLTLGARREAVRSSARGYTDDDSIFAPRTVSYNLFGAGAEYLTGESTALYGNITQAYRPILYEGLTPFGSVTRIDPNLRAAHGYNAEGGWRGTLWEALKFDLGLFYLLYRDRIGKRSGTDANGTCFTETTNIGNSVHRGAEAYVEFDPLAVNGRTHPYGSVDVFTSMAYVDARYVSGEFKGNRVEQAPRVVGRVGLTYALGSFASTLQASRTSKAYGDANNSVVPTEDAVAGLVPSYTVLDYSGQLAIGPAYQISFGINNLANQRYFTKRTGEYPGPGILPGAARSVYLGIGARF